jgi:hypothetical protein
MPETNNNEELKSKSPNAIKDNVIDGLIAEIIPMEGEVEKEPLIETINGILRDYNLSTDNSFIERIAKMKIGDNKSGKIETVDLETLPQELRDASFLPVNTIADIALRQDIDLVISQIPEYYVSLGIVRDTICEADVVTGRLARNITFDKVNINDTETENIMKKIEDVEERLELHQLIKNHMVFNTLEYGEGYVYVIPYAKVFADLYKFRINNNSKKYDKGEPNMFETSSVLDGYGYHEHAVETRLVDTVINDSVPVQPVKKNGEYKRKVNDIYTEAATTKLFTEAEIMEINPSYHQKVEEESKKEQRSSEDKQIDAVITEVAKNISYIEDDVALPVIEHSVVDMRAVYREKYKDNDTYIQEADNLFENIMNSSSYVMEETATEKKDDEYKYSEDNLGVPPEFSKVKGVYTRILPATKLIPIRIDRVVIGYYYISDLTRPEEAGERKNSGLHGYTLRTPSIGYDTFSPDQMFCEKLATKIINNFNLKFMRDNIAIHKQIVAVLEAHKFNEARMRFVFIPAEHVVQCTINKDGMGKGHSMLEAGLITARMYMFLKLYSLLYQINNSQLRVYNLRSSGIDKNYKALIQDTMRKFAARRVTANDIFNYRSSMTKVSGGSELIMPLGPGDKKPIEIETVEAAQAPINMDLLDSQRNEAINANPVPSAMTSGAMSELEFAKEVELANTRLNSYTSSLKIDMNPDITRLYRVILKWETDIAPEILANLKFSFKMNTAKTLSVTTEMLNNFNAVRETIHQVFLTKDEQAEAESKDDSKGGVGRELDKLLIAEYLTSLDVDRIEQLVNEARKTATKNKLAIPNKNENMLDEKAEIDEEEGMM